MPPASILSRMVVSTSVMPPTVRMVVTPLMSWVLAALVQIFSPTFRKRELLVTSFTAFLGSLCFFWGLPEEGRWTWRFTRPGIRYPPRRSTFS